MLILYQFPISGGSCPSSQSNSLKKQTHSLDNLVWVNTYVISKNLLRTYYGFTSHRHQEHEVWNLTDLSAILRLPPTTV